LLSFGIEAARLTFRRNTTMRDYLSYYHEVDLCLDPIPYCGGTTTCHALWMGVPTVTLAGQTPAQRSGAAILGHVNLGAFVSTSSESYVETAVGWTQRLEELSVLRQQIRETFARSAMCDPRSHAMALFDLLRTWRDQRSLIERRLPAHKECFAANKSPFDKR
jgi:predicted O-linked N-acetylglucosamine transferase (SPINDLY family)